MLTSLRARLLAVSIALAFPYLARFTPLGPPFASLEAWLADWFVARRPARRVTFRNKSKLLVDVYLDQIYPTGELKGTLKPKRGTAEVDCRTGDRFFFTRHGSHEQLVDEAGARIEAAIAEGDEEEVVLPKGAQLQGLRCLDRYPRFCSFQAQRGECTMQPGWMVINCCASCDGQDTLNISHTRAVEGGDLERLFGRVRGNESWGRFGPRVLKSPPEGPWVVALETFLSSEECEALVGHGERLGFRRSVIQGSLDLGEVGEGRTSSTAWCDDEACREDPVLAGLKQNVEALLGIPQRDYNAFQLLHYEKGQHYRRHLDVAPGDKIATSAAGPRILTLFLYLTDVEQGGATAFPKLGVRFRPRRGAALLWANVLSSAPEEVDERMMHEAAAVKRGVKKAANLWIHLYDHGKSFLWGCA